MKYGTLIFDLDGVICHTDDYHYQAWKQIADQLGIYFDREINNRLRGVSRMESFDIILERYEGEAMSDEQKVIYAEAKNDVYKELLGNMSPSELSDEVRETLTTLKEKGYVLTIGSSSKNARFILEKLGILDWFYAISDGNNITNSKPDPEVFVKAAEMVSKAPENCIVVEDAKAGVIAGNAAKMDTIAMGDAVTCGLATYNIESFAEILHMV